MRYLVTGGAGFIGSHLVERLVQSGETVRIFDCFTTGRPENLESVSDQIEIVKGDVRDFDALRNAATDMERIFHLAAVSSVPRSTEDPRTAFEVNLNGTLNLLTAARDAGCRRVVLASSASVYGNATELPIRESTLPSPRSPYAISKLASEQLCAFFTQVHGLETVALRYFNVFGSRQDLSSPYTGVIALFAHAICSGAAATIYGDGTQSRDFVAVDNVVDATLLAANANSVAGQVFNVGSGKATSLNELWSTMNELAGTNIPVLHAEARTGDITHSVADITRARQSFSYDVKVSLLDGLERLLNEPGTSALR